MIAFASFRRSVGRMVVLALAIGLAACAAPADPGRMTVTTAPIAGGFPAPLVRAMCVRSVTGGEATNPLWVSKVDNAGFRTALSASMEQAALVAPVNACKYPVDANLLGLSQPIMGFDLQVTSHVNYKVYDEAGQPVLLDTVSAPFTATLGDLLIAVTRLQRANEGSIRASISQFLDKLRGLRLN